MVLASFVLGVSMDEFSTKKYSDRYVEVRDNYVEMISKIDCSNLYAYWLEHTDDTILASYVLEKCVNQSI